MVGIPIFDPLFPLEAIFAGQPEPDTKVSKVRAVLKAYVQNHLSSGDSCNAACSGTCIYTPTFNPFSGASDQYVVVP